MLRKTLYRLDAKFRAQTSGWRPLPERNPVLVYSMRKVGLTTLTATLRANGFNVYKQHSIVSEINHRYRDALARTGFPSQHWIRDGERFAVRLRRWRNREEHATDTHGRLKIFTFVKDPLTIAVSDFFMQLFELMPSVVEARNLRTPETLIRYLHKALEAANRGSDPDPVTHFLALVLGMPRTWFDEELLSTAGVKATNLPFEKGSGYVTHRGDRADVCIIRTDYLSDVGLDAVQSLLGVRPESLIHANVASKTSYGAIYRECLEQIRLDKTTVDTFYCNNWIRHFYDDEEIERFKQRWILGKQNSAPAAPLRA